MKLEFNRNSHRNVKTKELLSHHDVVFRAPVSDPTYGLPIGDGDSGYLLWLTEDTLHVQINNTGLIDDKTEGQMLCSDTDEQEATLCGGGQLNIEFPCPVFDSIYQNKFEARISLADATASVWAETPFSKTRIRGYACHSDKTAVITVDASFGEPMQIRSVLSHWGSRAMNHWYFGMTDDPSVRVDGTTSYIEEDCMCICQKLHGISFCIAVKVEAGSVPVQNTGNSHVAEAVFSKNTQHSQTYYLTVALGENTAQAKQMALKQIQEAVAKGAESIYQTHTSEWTDFWEKSYLSLPEKQEYLENLWYLNLYYANSQMRGSYPARPWQGIWGFCHDFAPWYGYLHYNLQHGTFPLEAANHPELTETYYRFRRNQLPYAEYFAKEVKHAKGAFYNEVCDMKGRMTQRVFDLYNTTPGSQIAMGMYQHYCYTGDEEFLANTALPVMRSTAEYYLDTLTLEEDGFYHLHGTTGYESPYVLLDDCITDMVMIRVLFNALIRLIPEEEAAPYKERLEKLAPFHKTDFLDDELDAEGNLLWGHGKGKKPVTDKVLCSGLNPRIPDGIKEDAVPESVFKQCLGVVKEQLGNKTRRTYGNREHSYYGFPDLELSPIFPSGLLGLQDKDTELYKLVMNSIYLHPEHADKCAIWCMMPIYMARLGMTEELETQLEQSIQAYIPFPQGFGGAENEYYSDRWKTSKAQYLAPGPIGTGVWCNVNLWRFRQFNYETLPILATAANEMLLQSHEGIVRLFPTISEDAKVSFCLAAAGGWLVHALFSEGECDVVIECVRGGELSLAIHHVKNGLVFCDANSHEILMPKEADGIYTLSTIAGQRISVSSEHAEKISIVRDYSKNMDVKRFGNVALGNEKEFL